MSDRSKPPHKSTAASDNEACCTCASLLNPAATAPTSPLLIDPSTEKPYTNITSSPLPSRRLPCCARAICAACLASNPRFRIYCPFCQVSSEPSPLPQGLRDPPAYTSPPGSPNRSTATSENGAIPEYTATGDLPPPYTSRSQANGSNSASSAEQSSTATTTSTTPDQDAIHHLHPDDTLASLSLAYRTPSTVLRTHNALFSELLLHARKTLAIPRSHYTGPSLSPDPVDSAEEGERKAAIRRFMVGAKCHEYEMAELYLRQAEGDVERAVERWRDDERWERENPYKGKEKGGRRSVGTAGGLVGQMR